MKIDDLIFFGWESHHFQEEPSKYIALSKVFETSKVLDYEIICAIEESETYSARCYLLVRKDGKLFEVEASHCSCHGYEDLWEPKEVSEKYLQNRFLSDANRNRFLQSYSDSDGLAPSENFNRLQIAASLSGINI